MKDLAAPYRDNIIGGLAGAALGGGISGLATDTTDDKTTADKWRHRLRNALTGGIAGTAVGAAAPMARDYLGLFPEKKPFEPTAADKIRQYVHNRASDALKKAPEWVQGVAKVVDDKVLPALNPAVGSDEGRIAAGAALGAPVGVTSGVLAHKIQNAPDLANGNKALEEQVKLYRERAGHDVTPGTPGTPAVPPLPGTNQQPIPAKPATPGKVVPKSNLPGHGPSAPAMTKKPMSNLSRLEELERLQANSGRTVADLSRAGISSRPTAPKYRAGMLAFLAGQLGVPALAYQFGSKPPEVPVAPAKPAPAIK